MTTVAAYLPVFQAGFLNYDDGFYVTANPFIRSGLNKGTIEWAFTSFYAANWHPLTWLSHALDVEVFGMNAAGPHVVNLFLHVVNSILLFLLLYRLTGAVWRSSVVAALFALHPLHVESVAWISERKDVLSGCFFMLTLLAYASYASCPDKNRKTAPYWLVLFCFALGLACKPMLVTVPFVLLLLDYWPLCRFDGGRVTLSRLKSLVIEKFPLLFLAGASCAITFIAQKNGGATELTHFPWSWRLENAAVSYARYLGKTVWPTNLAVFYPHPGHWAAWPVFVATALLTGVTLFAIKNASRRPFLLVGWLWFIGTLVPVIGLVQVGMQSMADRYMYLPAIGLFIATTWTAAPILAATPRIAVAMIVVVLMACAGLTFAQARTWCNSETLSRHAIAVTHDNAVAEFSLAIELERRGQYPEAIQHYLNTVNIKPDDAETCNDLGECLLRAGDATNALRYATRAVTLAPRLAEAHYNLANAEWLLGQTASAIQQYQAAVALKPDFAEAHFNLGVAFENTGDSTQAIEQYRQALRFRPDWSEPSNNLVHLTTPAGP